MTISKESVGQGETEIAQKKDRAISAVIATNALISPEQFLSLKNALGQKATIEYDFYVYLTGEDSSNNETDTETFVLKDFSYVEDKKTGDKYLAFFRSVEDNATHFPYWASRNCWEDYKSIKINNLKLLSGDVLWSFDLPKERILNDDHAGSNIDWQAIKDYSKSALETET
jgi:hypothetical protein